MIKEKAIARLYGRIVGENEDATDLLREMTDKYGYEQVMSANFEIECSNGEKVPGR